MTIRLIVPAGSFGSYDADRWRQFKTLAADESVESPDYLEDRFV